MKCKKSFFNMNKVYHRVKMGSKKQGLAPCFSVGCFSVTFVELFDTAASLSETLLSCIERMGFAADINIDQRIFIAIFPFHSLVGSSCRTGQERVVSTDITENDWMIIRMDSLLHLLHLISNT